ncbi:hypothetical protein K3495_g2378 [Podosphaera aphanis]|nr:hypothetical protein K3495_g2378 [Podosphaera aphanis]
MTAKDGAQAANPTLLLPSPSTKTLYQHHHQVNSRRPTTTTTVQSETIPRTNLLPTSHEAPLIDARIAPPSRGPGATRTATSLTRKGKIHRGPPPPSMITRGHCVSPSPVRIWVSQQSITINNNNNNNNEEDLIKYDDSKDPSTLLSPSLSRSIRRRPQISSVFPLASLSPIAAEMSLRPPEQENHESQDESINDEGDLFLRAAQEEEHTRINHPEAFQFPNLTIKPRLKYTPSPENASQNSAQTRYREYQYEEVLVSPTVTRNDPGGRALTFASLKNNELVTQYNKNTSDSQKYKNMSVPTTPKGKFSDGLYADARSAANDRRLSTPYTLQHKYGGKTSLSISEKLQLAYDEARISSSEVTLPIRKAYRQSLGKPPTPHRYNSSPLVPRTIDIQDSPGAVRLLEDTTESTVSTTAQSAVWDELEDLKSRIQRLELSGKRPPSSGTPYSRSSNERPPTATTTVTSMSTSPKQDRAKSRSPTPQLPETSSGSEVNHLLKSALMKSKPTLSPEIYKSLEATACDAISIALMMGSSGQMGPISNSQSSTNPYPAASDRQVRRKAESMLRSLTELCLVLSEEKPACDTQISHSTADGRLMLESTNTETQITSPRSTLVKSSPRTLTRLEARRSSLLVPSPSSRIAMAHSGNSALSNPPAGRRASLYLRNTPQVRTEGSEESSESRLRLPSRSHSELNPIRNISRDRALQLSFPEKCSNPPSSLPLRRYHTSISLTPTTPLPINSLVERRVATERLTTEQTQKNKVFGHKQRISSLGHPIGFEPSNLSRRIRHPSAADYGSVGRNLSYH